MSEKIDKNQDIKKNKKSEELVEKYQYVPEKNEQLIVDKPLEPLVKKEELNIRYEQPIKSNKELYDSYIKELKYFSLILNNDVIYDSSIDKSSESPLKFENEYFVLYGRKYSYNGLKIQKINKR